MKFEIHWAISGTTEVEAEDAHGAQLRFDMMTIEQLAKLDGDLEQLEDPIPVEEMADEEAEFQRSQQAVNELPGA